jgi:hypothetical protein
MCGTSLGVGCFVDAALDSAGVASFDLLAERVGERLRWEASFDRVSLKVEVRVQLDQCLSAVPAKDVEANGSESSATDTDGVGLDVR